MGEISKSNVGQLLEEVSIPQNKTAPVVEEVKKSILELVVAAIKKFFKLK